MKSLPLLTLFGITACLSVHVQSAQAQVFENNWQLSAHAGYTSLDATTRNTTGTEGGTWWGDHDDSNINYGLSLTYFPWGNLGVRATYERGSDFRTRNRCPDNGVCPAIAINEFGSMEHYALAVAPEFDIYQNTIAFITLGAARTEVDAGPRLPSYRETDFIYGAGIGFQVSRAVYVSGEYQTTNSDFETVRLAVGVRF
jgi:opacity protein-like surface antigen